MKKVVLFFTLFSSLISDAQIPTWQWANAYGGSDFESPTNVAVGANGDVYLAGRFSSPSISFGSTTLTNAGTSTGSYDIFLVKINTLGVVQWATAVSGTASDEPSDISVDANGNVFITGRFSSPTLNFGTTTISNTGSLNTDFFIAKYNASGVLQWAQGNGSNASNADFGLSLQTDMSGNVVVCGYFSMGSITFGVNTFINTGTGGDLFLVKYSSSGSVLWATSASGPGNDIGQSLSTDLNGNFYMTGTFEGSISFGTTTLTAVSNTYSDIFIAKYSASGSLSWAISAGGTNNDHVFDISTDAAGDILIAGRFQSPTLSFGSISITNGGYIDAYIAKYSQAGIPQWALSAGGTGADQSRSVAVDPSGNIYLWGTFTSATLSFGSQTVTKVGPFDGFLVRFNSAGVANWATNIGAVGASIAAYGGVASDGSGNVFFNGGFLGASINLGTLTLGAPASDDVFLAKLGPGCTTVPAQPGIITGTVTPCSGSSQTYSVAAVTGATSYTWLLPSGWTGTSTSNSIIATAGTTGGNITVTAVNACGTSTAQTLAVTVSPGPSATITAAGATSFCQGGNVILNANTGTGLSYQWKLNGTNITGATNGSYTANASGSYTVVVTSSSCSSTSAATTVTVNPLPTPAISQAANTLTAPSGFSTYKWYKNSTLITGATSSAYTATQSGSYYVVVTDANNCSGQSNTLVITIGINDVEGDELVTINPNPTSGKFTITGKKVSFEKDITIEVVDFTGRTILSDAAIVKQGAFEKEVDLSGYSAGAYIIRVRSGSLNQTVQLIKR
jgi:large repetitive protein